MEHDETTLPKWAQERLAALRKECRQTNSELQRLQLAHTVLNTREWFTLDCPVDLDPKRTLWFLDRDAPLSFCTIFPGDIFLVGRAKKQEQ